MNKIVKRALASAAAVAVSVGLLAGCSGYSEEYKERKAQQSQAREDSLSRQNQEERLAREENESQIRYLYILPYNSNTPLGYYTVQGKVSSAGVQNAPENDIIDVCGSSYCPEVVDSAKDDGTYGPSETGFFFFTTEDVLIEMEGVAYIQSDAPIRLFLDAPLLNEQ